MAKRVFFSFHYEDVKTFRANTVRNHGLTKEIGTSGFFDASIWEDAELHGDNSVKRLINSGLHGTTVTCVLIGTETWRRRWVRYEILKSYDRDNLLLGIHINGIKDKYGYTYNQGLNPFKFLGLFIDSKGKITYYEKFDGDWSVYKDLEATQKNIDTKFWDQGYSLAEWVHCYDWINNNGYQNFSTWIDRAK
jgi:hypothetical protein